MALDVLAERHVASVCTSIDRRRLEHTIGVLHELVMDVVGEQGLAPSGPLFSRYHRFGSVITLEAGIPLAQPIRSSGVVSAGTLPGGPIVHARHVGVREPAPDRFAELDRFCSIRGLRAVGAPWECYVVDGRDTPDVDEWVTDLFVPVRPIHRRLRHAPFGGIRSCRIALPRNRSIR